MNKIVFSLIFIPFCASAGSKFTEINDPYDGSKTAGMSGISTYACPGVGKPFVEDIYITLAAVKDKAGKSQYMMDIGYFNNEWLFIRKSTPIDVLIDGSTEQFDISKTTREVKDGGIIVEDALILLKRSDIEKIANSNQFRFRLHGDKGMPERCISQNKMAPFKEFLERTVSYNNEDIHQNGNEKLDSTTESASPTIPLHKKKIITGHEFNPDDDVNLVKGQSTISDAIKLFGSPLSTSTLSNGSTLIQWMYVGLVDNTHGISAHIALLFDSSGKYIKTTQKMKM